MESHKGFFVYLLYFQYLTKNGSKQRLQKHRHKPLNDKYFLNILANCLMRNMNGLSVRGRRIRFG